VVDDDPYIRRLVERTLHEGNHTVLLAGNGNEALRLVALHKAEISMVILDVLMPGMTGGELGRRLAVECRAKQLFISGYSPEHLPPGSHGGSEFLQKPFTPSELLARVRKILEG
jgi:DNA-binding response OmpR family regulator